MGTIGRHPDGDAYPADAHDLGSYRQAQAQLDRLRVPLLLHADDPHQRLYVAALDGTGNSLYDDQPEHWSVVAKIYQQIRDLKTEGVTNIAAGYVEGTFTQNGLLRTPERLWDGRFAHTFDERVETAYYELCVQAKAWLQQDPQAQIRVVGVGFSRGAEEVAALLRLIHERGIRDPDGARYAKDREGLITRIEYADRPPLVPPGRTLQAALLFDPVATGVEDHDRRLPASTLTTFQISAEDERRNLFPVSDHVPPGLSEDDRNLNVIVGGAHSDIGNTYARDGLGLLSFNLGVQFLNRLGERPFLRERPVPEDPSAFVVHRSELGMGGLYGTSRFDRAGARLRREDQSPQPGIQHKDPIAPALEAQVTRRTGDGMPGMVRAPDTGVRSQCGADLRLEQALAAYLGDDMPGLARVMDAYRRSPEGQAWQRQQCEFARLRHERERQEACATEAPAPQGMALRR